MDIKYDYHNNDIVAELQEFIHNPPNRVNAYTDYEYLCAVAHIIRNRKLPPPEVTDCNTGFTYKQIAELGFIKALNIARRNAGQ